jgi:hypothetical protein
MDQPRGRPLIQGIGTENGQSTCLTAANQGVSGSLVYLAACLPPGQGLQTWFIDGYGEGGIYYYKEAFAGYTQIYLELGEDVCLDRSGGPSVDGGTGISVAAHRLIEFRALRFGHTHPLQGLIPARFQFPRYPALIRIYRLGGGCSMSAWVRLLEISEGRGPARTAMITGVPGDVIGHS